MAICFPRTTWVHHDLCIDSRMEILTLAFEVAIQCLQRVILSELAFVRKGMACCSSRVLRSLWGICCCLAHLTKSTLICTKKEKRIKGLLVVQPPQLVELILSYKTGIWSQLGSIWLTLGTYVPICHFISRNYTFTLVHSQSLKL